MSKQTLPSAVGRIPCDWYAEWRTAGQKRFKKRLRRRAVRRWSRDRLIDEHGEGRA